MTMSARRPSRSALHHPAAIGGGPISSSSMSSATRRRSSNAALLLASIMKLDLDDDDISLDKDMCLYPTSTEKGENAASAVSSTTKQSMKINNSMNDSGGGSGSGSGWGVDVGGDSVLSNSNNSSMSGGGVGGGGPPIFISEEDLREKTQALIMSEELWGEFKKELNHRKVHTGVGVKMVLHKFITERMSQQQDANQEMMGEKQNVKGFAPAALLEGLLGGVGGGGDGQGGGGGVGGMKRRKSGAITAMFGNVDLSDEASAATAVSNRRASRTAAAAANTTRSSSAYSKRFSLRSQASDASSKKTISSAPALATNIGDMPNRMIIVDPEQQEQELQERPNRTNSSIATRRRSRGSASRFSQSTFASSIDFDANSIDSEAESSNENLNLRRSNSLRVLQEKSLSKVAAGGGGTSRTNSSNSMARAAAIVAAMDFDDVPCVSDNSEPDTDDDSGIMYGVGGYDSASSFDFALSNKGEIGTGAGEASGEVISGEADDVAGAGADDVRTLSSADASSISSGALAAARRLPQDQHLMDPQQQHQQQGIIQGNICQIEASNFGMGNSAGNCNRVGVGGGNDFMNDNASIGGLSSALSVGFLDDLLEEDEEGSDLDDSSLSDDSENEKKTSEKLNSKEDEEEEAERNKSFMNGLLFLAPTKGNSISTMFKNSEKSGDGAAADGENDNKDDNPNAAAAVMSGLPSLKDVRRLKQALLQQQKPHALDQELLASQQQRQEQPQTQQQQHQHQQRHSSSSLPERQQKRGSKGNKGRKSYSHPLSAAANQRIATARCGWLPSDDEDDDESACTMDSELSPQPRWFDIRHSSSQR